MGGKVSLHDDEEGNQSGDRKEDIGSQAPLTGIPKIKRFSCSWFMNDMKVKIAYVTLFGVFVGLGVPLILYLIDKPNSPTEVYGSCMIKNEYRFKCLMNQAHDPSEEECIDAMCCWENNETLLFKCYHSVSPAYQYHVESSVTIPGSNEPLEINLKPNQARMSKLRTKLLCVNSNQLNIQIFDPVKFPDGMESKAGTLPCTDDNVVNGFIVTFSEDVNSYFYIRIGRRETNETLFDTRIAPFISDEENISFGTVLPTQFFHGFKGGQGNGPTIYDVVKGFSNMDLPFYMPKEKNGRVHGVLFETRAPFVVQYIEAPGLMFHFQGSQLGINLHFFVGPTVKDVSGQLYSHLTEGGKTMERPPYWALGLHLCPSLSEEETALKLIHDIDDGLIPHDSTCIDMNLRTPFQLDENKYNESVLNELVGEINKVAGRHVIFAQQIGLVVSQYENISDESPFINWENKSALIGTHDKKKTYYINFHHSNIDDWLQDEFGDLGDYTSGLVLVDNFPFDEKSSSSCPRQNTRLEQKFLTSEGEGLVCPNAVHYDTDAKIDYERHFDLHNNYGHEALQKFENILKNENSDERTILSSPSVTVNSFPISGFSGLTVPFTWSGMVDSLTFVLKNFMFLPYASTPICGSKIPSNAEREDDELCLRWFQLGLLLPFARNTFGSDITRGPLHFNKNDQQNLINAIQERYRYNPYYYTLFKKYEETGEPPIRPLIYDFHEEPSVAFNVLSQFMIGSALMAAPVLSKAATTRDAYFPPGVWYEVTGALVYSNVNGTTLTIPGLPSVTPLFIRGGHVIPSLTSPVGLTAEIARKSPYTLLGTYPGPENLSQGDLFIDDGLTFTSSFHSVTFEVSTKGVTIISTCDPNARPPIGISTTINQVKIFGFPPPKPEVTTNIPGQTRPELDYSEEDLILRIKTFSYDWCDLKNVTFTWF